MKMEDSRHIHLQSVDKLLRSLRWELVARLQRRAFRVAVKKSPMVGWRTLTLSASLVPGAAVLSVLYISCEE